MKQRLNFKLPLLLCLIFFAQACKNQGTNSSTLEISKVPQLFNRSSKIQLGKEWDFVQNYYAKQTSALQKDKSDHEARLMLTQLFIKEARVTGEHGHYYPAALKMVNQVIEFKPLNQDLLFRALMTKAGVQLSLHNFAQALAIGKQAIAINPKNAQIYGVLVDANVELGNYEEAIKLADQMVSIKPDIRSYSRISYLREIHGDVKGAIQAMEMAVQSGYPGLEETAWAMQTLGELYIQYGDLNKAEKVFQSILKTRADYPFAVAALGEIQYQRNDFAKAEKTILESISIIPEVGFYMQMAQLFKNQNRQSELEAILEDILLMLQDDVDHGHNMNLEYADFYLNLKDDTDQALAFAKIEYEKRPDNIDVNRILAQIYERRNDADKVKAHTLVASRTNSQHPDLIVLLK